ncbi:hypothetical protein SAMN02745150_01227 [Brevinema andersonii]|uniref:Uncharacterized protein n=1 Tax=Brevinema andersonii TaxID=34097 RepID=A0A1I1ESN3_BREAD|nr:hypothetical protein [Brevinema andersonii]SFB89712.1 hypothetical protein SAMN02745150_01227 [Brevinema andersonii]
MVVERPVDMLSRASSWYNIYLEKKSGRFKVSHEVLERLVIMKLHT